MLKTVRNSFLLISIGLMSLVSYAAHAARHALLIGNDTYQEVPTLRNARADAQAMALALEKAIMNPSPWTLTSKPPCCAISSLTSR